MRRTSPDGRAAGVASSILILLVTLVLASVFLSPFAYSQTVVATVNVGTDPYGAAYDSGKGEVFVVNYGSDTVSVISDATNTVTATVNVGSAPYGAAYDSGMGEVFVTNDGSNSVSVISDASNTVVATVTAGIGNGPIGVVYDSGMGEVFVTNEASGTVSVISDATNTVIATVTLGVSGPISAAYDSVKGYVFVTSEASGTVSVISDATNTLIATVKVGNYPIGVAYDPVKGEVFVANDGSNTVSVMSDVSNTVTATVTVGSGPIGVAYDSGLKEVFVTNDGSNTVSVISDATNTVIATVKVGNYPIGEAYDSAKGEVFVVNDGSGTVSVVSDSASTSTTSTSTTSTSTTSTSTTSTIATTTITIPPTSSTTTTISTTTTVTATAPATSSTTTTISSTTTTTTTIPVSSGTTTITSTTYTTSTVPTSCAGPCAATILTVSCHTASVAMGTSDTCKATVESPGSTPTGNVVWSALVSPSGSGTFSSTACQLSNYNSYYPGYYSSCSVSFAPTALPGDFVHLTANYVGDSLNSPSSGTSSQLVVTLRSTTTTASCTPKSAVAGSLTIITCTAKLAGSSPTGTVTWSQSGVGSVLFSATTCTLSSGSCSVTLTGVSAGTVKLRAAYYGDSNNAGSSRTTTVSIGKAPTSVAVSCTQSPLGVGSSITCTATVSGSYSSHTGMVSWTKASGKGRVTLSSKTCTLSSGSCSVTVVVTTSGSFTVKATYGGDPNNLRNWGTAINKASPTITPSLSSTAVAVGTSVTDSATLSGGYKAQGTVAYEYFSSNTCTGPANAVGLPVIVTNGVVPASVSQFFVTPGTYSWNAVYSGDTNNNGATSLCQSLVINSPGVSISIVLSASTVTSGLSVYGSATLSGATSSASGIVTYEFFSGPYCSGSATAVGSVVVASGVVPNSASQVFSSPGYYSWNAVYGGDSSNNGATSPCKPLNVRGIPTIATSLSAAVIGPGSSVFDTSTLTGTTSTAGGSVQYEYFSGSTCIGTAIPVGSPVKVTNGVVPSSASQQFGSDGYYSWNAVYSGDANNNGATSACESLTVGAIITTTLSSSAITTGSSVTDSASISGATPNAGGTVTYQTFSGNACAGTAIPVGSPVTVTNGIVPNSMPVAFSAGLYSWNAVYSGDSNNIGSTSQCEPLTVNPALVAPGISVSQTAVTSGGSATLTTTTPFSGGTPTYTCQWLEQAPGGVYTDLGSSFSCTTASTPSASTGTLSITGPWNFELQVTDSSSPPVTVPSAYVTVTVS